MKHLIIRLVFLLPIPLIIMSVNYFVDPANIFRKNYTSGIVDYLMQGYHVTNIGNCNERLLQKNYINRLERCPAEIVFGSSRAILIGESMIQSNNLVNSALSGATLEDFLAIYYLYEQKGWNNISKIIFVLDPWILNDNHGDMRWKTLQKEYQIFYNILFEKNVNNSFKLDITIPSHYKELLSLSYLNTSVLNMFHHNTTHYLPTKEFCNEGMTKHTDGSICYGINIRNATIEEQEKMIDEDFNNARRSFMANFTHLNPDYCLIFSKFIEYIQNKNTEVVFLLAPVLPKIYEYYEKNEYFKIVFDVENYFIGFAKKHQIKVLGSFNPAKYNFDDSGFYDGFHAKPETIKKILDVEKNELNYL
jgi:hypothetical protein